MSDDSHDKKGVWASLVDFVQATLGMAIIAGLLLALPSIVKGCSKAAGTIKKAAVDGWNEGSKQ